MPGTNRGKGYLLPAGLSIAAEPDYNCVLVYYPDLPEYRRALFGSLEYLSTWLAWERDDTHAGLVAAGHWKTANEMTREDFDMGCLTEIVARLDITNQLLAKLSLPGAAVDLCCKPNIVIVPPEPIIITIDPGVGTVPAVYGETPIADWDEWLVHACYNAHRFVDVLIDQNELIGDLLQYGTLAIGVIGGILGALASGGLLLPVAYATAASVFGGLVGHVGSTIFDGVETSIENVREEIVNAIVCGNASLSDVIESAIGGTLAWTVFYQFANWNAAVQIVREGGYEGQYLPDDIDAGCNCPDTELRLFTHTGGYCWVQIGGEWVQIGPAGVSIQRGIVYPIQAPAGVQDAWVQITDAGGINIDVDVTLNTNLPSGNGLFWSVWTAADTPLEENVLHTVPGGYPITWPLASIFRARQNIIYYGSAYYITLLIAE